MKIDDFKKKLKLTQKSYKEYSNIKAKVILLSEYLMNTTDC